MLEDAYKKKDVEEAAESVIGIVAFVQAAE
jgi:hypothetical protein